MAFYWAQPQEGCCRFSIFVGNCNGYDVLRIVHCPDSQLGWQQKKFVVVAQVNPIVSFLQPWAKHAKVFLHICAWIHFERNSSHRSQFVKLLIQNWVWCFVLSGDHVKHPDTLLCDDGFALRKKVSFVNKSIDHGNQPIWCIYSLLQQRMMRPWADIKLTCWPFLEGSSNLALSKWKFWCWQKFDSIKRHCPCGWWERPLSGLTLMGVKVKDWEKLVLESSCCGKCATKRFRTSVSFLCVAVPWVNCYLIG